MFHVVTFFTVAPEGEKAFVRTLGSGGEWLSRALSVAPELVASDLLRLETRLLYLAHDILQTREAYCRARGDEVIGNIWRRGS